jgi:hypothetical protein
MKRGEKEVAPPGETPTIDSFPYISGTGKCIIKKLGGARPFAVYFVEKNGPPKLMGTHKTQANAESAARWMAMGL